MRRGKSRKPSRTGHRRVWRRSPRRRGKWRLCSTSAPLGNGLIARAVNGDGWAYACARFVPSTPPRVPSRSNGSPAAGSTGARPGRRPSRPTFAVEPATATLARPWPASPRPWELAIADALEDRFAEIRRLARSVSNVRTAFRHHAKLERTLFERGEDLLRPTWCSPEHSLCGRGCASIGADQPRGRGARAAGEEHGRWRQSHSCGRAVIRSAV
jgi:hypothetical protein